MYKLPSKIIIVISVFFLFSCNNGKESRNLEIQIERAKAEIEIAKAEAEEAKLKAVTAEVERKAMEDSLSLLKENQRIKKEVVEGRLAKQEAQKMVELRRLKKEDDERVAKQEVQKNDEWSRLKKAPETKPLNHESEINKKELNLNNSLGEKSLAMVKDNSVQILKLAYPMAGNKLKYSSVELIGTGSFDNGYYTTVRLNYKNLFRKAHYLDLKFDHDLKGDYRSWKFVSHSDVIAPKELTLETLLKLIH